MNKEALAAILDGRQYMQEITKSEEAQAKASGLVVVFGASDDLIEFRGAIDDELGGFNEKVFCVTPRGLLTTFQELKDSDASEDEFAAYFQDVAAGYQEIRAYFSDGLFSWTFETSIPHATFNVMEDSDYFCRGIVFSLAELVSPIVVGTLTKPLFESEAP
jgi:hypothetical protein